MARKRTGENIRLKSLDDIFSTEESRQDEEREKVMEIPLEELHPFKNHPFRVTDDDAMKETVESVIRHGILVPAIARPRDSGGYGLDFRTPPSQSGGNSGKRDDAGDRAGSG